MSSERDLDALESEVLNIADACLRDSISDEQLHRLDSLIRDEPEARKIYAASIEDGLRLRAWAENELAVADAGIRHVPSDSGVAVDIAKSIGAAAGVGHRPVHAPLKTFRSSTPYHPRARSRNWPRSRFTVGRLVAASLAVACCFVAFQFIRSRGPRPDIDGTVAVVIGLENVKWSKECLPIDLNSSVIKGDVLRIDSGSVELRLSQGATLRVNGPAEWSIKDKNRASVVFGLVAASVPPIATGFVVETPTARVVDFGTEFDISVRANGDTQVEVRLGLIEVAPRLTGSQAASKVSDNPTRLHAGQAAVLTRTSQGKIEARTASFGTISRFGKERDGKGKLRAFAYQAERGASGNQAWHAAVGLDFDVVSPIFVHRLGAFDHLSDGISPSSQLRVQLWSRRPNKTPANSTDDDGGELLVEQRFSATEPGDLIGGYRWKPLDKPLLLPAGHYSILADGFSTVNLDYSDGDYVFPNIVTCDTNGGLIVPRATRHVARGQAGFPKTMAKNPTAFAAGSFEYSSASN